MKLKKIHWTIIVVVALLILIIFSDSETEKLLVKVKNGAFSIEVNTSGELKAKKSEDIKGPSGLRSQQIYNIKITDLITEGTYVQSGDYVAQLDKSDVGTKIASVTTEVEKITSEYEQARLDTAIEMMKLRDELINLNYEIEEKKLIANQSSFEAPVVQKQNENNLEKAERKLQQSIRNISLKRKQNTAKLHQISLSLKQVQSKLTRLEELMISLKIVAPKKGMVVYKRTWDGKKITSGSSIGVWNPTVATLPDLSKMVTKTYVNEIDISHIKKGLTVGISIDAFPDKSYTGKVVEVANVGEQLPNTDSKVFEVMIEINERDTLLRPAMTTNNNILIEELKEVLFIPQESVFVNDSISYVVLKTGLGLKKQQVDLGKTNSNFVVIKKGLKEGEELLMVKPEDVESISWR